MFFDNKTKLAFLGVILLSGSANAQMVECNLVGVSPGAVVNGCIAKSLADQIGSGQGDIDTFGASIYLINRDPARAVRRGRQLFQRKFSETEGLGPRVNPRSAGSITENRAFGAGFADSCAACHGRPKGSAGFGGDVQTRPDSRDAPHLFGLGLVEQIADEMTTKLRAIRKRALKRARRTGTDQVVELNAKKINFGTLIAYPNGEINTSDVKGVNTDLRVRPFFNQGQTVSIREFIVGAFNDEMGLQAWDPILCKVTDPVAPEAIISPSGFRYDPNIDRFERPAVCDPNSDPDGDKVTAELDPALIDHLEFYLLNYFKPGTYRTTNESRKGRKLMATIGCTECHKPNMRIEMDRRVADVETTYDAEKGIFNGLFATATPRFVEIDDGDDLPLVQPAGNSFLVRDFYSDLKRHDLGPAFHEREYDGNTATLSVTEPLWGVGSTAPYGHDGRSINLDAVIRRHGGDAAQSKLNYVALTEKKQMQLQSFLQTLVLFPPDDTASNLNPGVPEDNLNIQDPASHGSINLGALFRIEEEGVE